MSGFSSMFDQLNRSMIKTSKNPRFLTSVKRVQSNLDEWPEVWLRILLINTDIED